MIIITFTDDRVSLETNLFDQMTKFEQASKSSEKLYLFSSFLEKYRQTNNFKKAITTKEEDSTTYSGNFDLQNRACCMPYALRCSKSAFVIWEI